MNIRIYEFKSIVTSIQNNTKINGKDLIKAYRIKYDTNILLKQTLADLKSKINQIQENAEDLAFQLQSIKNSDNLVIKYKLLLSDLTNQLNQNFESTAALKKKILNLPL